MAKSIPRPTSATGAVTAVRLPLLLLAAALIFAALIPLAAAEIEPAVIADWPKFRADQWNTGTTLAPAPADDDLYWVFEAPMGEYDFFGFVSSAAVVDHIIYVGNANGYVYAIDEASGKKIWEFVVDDWIEGTPFPIWSSVAVDPERERVYAVADKLYAIDMNDGSLAWKWETPSFWEFSSPTLEEDVIYLGGLGGYLYAINADDGSEKWTFETGERTYFLGNEVYKDAGGAVAATPAVGPDLVYIVDFDENLYAVDKQTGEMIFTQGFEEKVPGTNTPIEWGPIDMGAGDGFGSIALDIERNMLFIGDTAGYVYGMSMDPDDNNIDDDGNGRIDDEGKEIWREQTGDAISASPVLYDGTVYISSWDQTMYAYDPLTGNQKWSASFDGYPWGSVSAADGLIFQNTLDYQGGRLGWLYAFDAEDGDVAWNFTQNEFMVSTPTPYNGKLLVGDTGYRLIMFGPDGPKPDLFVEDVTVSDEFDDGQRIVYATFGNRGGIRAPPAELHIYVDDEEKYNQSFDPLEAGELAAANVKLTISSGSHEVRAKVIQRPTTWYHIPEVNTDNNEGSTTVGGVVEVATSAPVMFSAGLVTGGGVALGLVAGGGGAWWLARRGFKIVED